MFKVFGSLSFIRKFTPVVVNLLALDMRDAVASLLKITSFAYTDAPSPLTASAQSMTFG